MSTLSAAQIAAVAAGAGFHGTGLRNAVAVALAESGGRTNAVGVNSDRYRSRDRGLWQINDHWHPEVSDAAAFDPARAAAAAYRISAGGSNWSAWSTWKNGSAQAQFGRAQLAIGKAGTAPAAGTAQNVGLNLPDPLDPLLGGLGLLDLLGGKNGVTGGIGSTLDAAKAGIALAVKAGAWMADAHNWGRVAMVTGGTVGVLVALDMIGKSGAAGSTAQQIAAIPGAAAKHAAKAAGAVATDGASVAATGL